MLSRMLGETLHVHMTYSWRELDEKSGSKMWKGRAAGGTPFLEFTARVFEFASSLLLAEISMPQVIISKLE